MRQHLDHWSVRFSLCVLCCGWSGALLRADDFEAAKKHYAAHEWQDAATAWEKIAAESAGTARAAEAEFYWAESLVGMKSYSDAVIHFRRFIQLEPKHRLRAQAEFRIGECHFLQADYATAWNALQAFAVERPDHPLLEYVLPYMGFVKAKEGDRPASKRLLVEALARFPKGALSEEARLRLVHLAIAEGDAETVFSVLVELEAIDPDVAAGAEWRLARGMAYQMRSNHRLAVEQLKQVDVGQLAPARGAAAVFALASSYRRLGMWAEAAQELERLLKTWPQSAYHDRAELARYDSLLRNGQAKDALPQILAFLERLPEGTMRREVVRLRVQALLQLDQVAEAIQILEDLCQETAKLGDAASHSERVRNWYQLASAQLRAEQGNACLQALDRIRTDDLSADWRLRIDYLRGSALVRLKRWEDAVSVLKLVMERAKDTEHASKTRAKYLEALIGAGDPEPLRVALRSWRPDARDAIDCLQMIKDLADERKRQSDIETALAAYKALALHQVESSFRREGFAGLGWVHYDLGQWEEAVQAFEELERLASDSELTRDSLLARAFALEQLERHDESLRCYRTFLERFPHQPGARQAALGLALGLQQRRRYEDAARSLRAALEEPEEPTGPSDVRLHYQLGLVLKAMRRSGAAAEEFQKIYEGPRESAYWSEATYRLAEMAFVGKDYERVTSLLAELHQSLATPTGDPLDASLAPHQVYLEARVAFELEQWNEALTLFDHMLVDFPDSPLVPSARRWSAETLFRLQDYANARVRLEAMLREPDALNPSLLRQVRLRYAQVLAALHEWPSALELARTLHANEETVAQAAERELLEARCLTAMESWQDARAIYQRLLLTELDESYRSLIQEQLQQLNQLEGERTGEQLPISTSVPETEESDAP